MSHRDGFAPDVGGLGRKVERQKDDPLPREIAPGIIRDPDGKLRTSLPLPPIHIPTPVWPPIVDPGC